MPELSEIAVKLRLSIMAAGDHARAIEVANEIVDQALIAFNDANTDVATSIMARALLVNGMIEVAATWMNDETKLPTPECFAAFRSLIDDPPPWITGNCWKDPSIG